MPAAIGGLVDIDAFLTGAAVGASFGRTSVLFRTLASSGNGGGRSGQVSDAAIVGGVLGIVAMLVAGSLGVESLPTWAYVPAVVVAVQTGFSLTMDSVLTRALGPLSDDPRGPTYEQIAFTMYGTITLPGLAIFILTMSVVSIL